MKTGVGWKLSRPLHFFFFFFFFFFFLLREPPPGSYAYSASTLTKGSKWQITQIWENYVFRLDLTYSSSIPILEQKHSSCWKIFKSKHHDNYWYQWTWQTHFAHLREISFSRVGSFCQSTAVFITTITLSYSLSVHCRLIPGQNLVNSGMLSGMHLERRWIQLKGKFSSGTKF